MSYSFEWDPQKEQTNIGKHGIDFDEAASVFADPLAEWSMDERAYSGEERFIALGRSLSGRLILVVFTEREGCVRIIRARIPRAYCRSSWQRLREARHLPRN
jgi:uncharacterized DUF497 family protein